MTTLQNKYQIRNYRTGDEFNLIHLFNKAFEDFVGFVPRTLEYWNWCVKQRPGISNDSIAIITNTDKTVGYAVVEKSGNILEFCYDQSYDGKTVVSTLLNWCINYVKLQGGKSVTFNAPSQDDLIRQICQDWEFSEQPFEQAIGTLFMRVLDLPKLLEEVIDQKAKIGKKFDEIICINLKNVPSWCDKHVIVQVRAGEVIIQRQQTSKPTININVDISTISSCILGQKRSIFEAILRRQLRVHPFWKIPRAAKILSSLHVRNPWYIPGADYG